MHPSRPHAVALGACGGSSAAAAADYAARLAVR
jgi:hypothetical protein